MSMNLIALLYLVASVFFIQALKGLSHPTTSIRGNVFYTPMPKVDVGAELMYGVREIESGKKGDISRVQFTTKYSF